MPNYYYITARLIPVRKLQSGLTIIELMISITLGLLVILSATGLVISTKSLFVTQTDIVDTEDTARFALDNIARSIRQAGYINYDFSNSVMITPASASADLAGMDANSVAATSTDISTPLGTSVNNSDLLAVRFFGSGNPPNGDGTMSNCAGFSVPAAISPDTDRGWSIYYVALDANNEPQLMCKYYSNSGNWTAQAIVKGVESFQVLYGLDTNTPSNGLSNKFLTATNINALDQSLGLSGNALNAATYWKRIRTVKIAMLIRGTGNSRTDTTTTTYNLFGPDYKVANPNDLGTVINEQNLPAGTTKRVRKIYAATVQLRNFCSVDSSKPAPVCASTNFQ